MEHLERITEHSVVVDFILSEEWREDYDSDSLEAAEGALSGSPILGFEVVEIDTGELIIECSFRTSSRRYHQAEIVLNFDEEFCDFITRCSCPDGYLCMHSAALLMHTGRLLLEKTGTPNISKLGSPAVFNWLNTIKKLNEETENKSTKPPKPSNQSLAYCLHLANEYSQLPYISLRICKETKKEKMIDTFTTPTANPQQPARYMCNEDIFPCSLYHQLSRSYYSNEIPLEGEGSGKLLEEINKTDRLYFLKDETGHQQPAQRITLGETFHPNLAWVSQSNGSATPSLNLPPKAILIPTEPLFCFDEDTFELRKVSTEEHSAEFLLAWNKGPSIPAEKIEDIAPELTKAKLPKPTPLEKESLQKSKPTASLKLFRKNPFTHGGLHLSGQLEPTIAELSFSYHGHLLKPDLLNADQDLSSFSVVLPDKILNIQRDTIAELDLIETLITEGKISPISTHYDNLSEKYSSCFLPLSPSKEWDMRWACFITSTIPLLENNGWKITVEEESYNEVHIIFEDGLNTGIEELPDHGIDWFQFKASYITPSGEKASLLPILSRFIEDYGIGHINEQLATVDEDEKSIIQDPETGIFIAICVKQMLTLAKNIYELFGLESPESPLHRIQAAHIADSLELDSSQTLRALAELGKNLNNITTLPKPKVPTSLKAELRPYQLDGFHWLQFLARHSLHGILADDMGLGKTLQALTHIQAEVSSRRNKQLPSLVVAPTSVVGNWKAEAEKFTPNLKVLLFHGADRKDKADDLSSYHLILTTYGLLVRDEALLTQHDFHILALDEAQYIKNPASKASKTACKIQARHRISLSGTPIENHLGELWAQMRFLMPGILGSQASFRKAFRTPIEKHRDRKAQASLNRRVAPLILRRTKDQVATELPPKTHIVHTIPLNDQQIDVYETVRAVMDNRIRDAISEKGLAKSQIIVLDALLKLRQICCHPQLLKLPVAQKIKHSAKLDFLTNDLLPTLIEEGRKILLFSSFTSMLDLIEEHLKKKKIPYAKIVGKTIKRQEQITFFQKGVARVFLISLKAGGTGLNLTAADTVIHYDPWWNPAAENQATDRAHRIGQTKPVFVHKLISEDTIEQRIQELQAKKSALVDALLTADTTKLKIDKETLNNLLSPLH